ncbi:MAG: DUF5060 domain-containing protein [Pseudomonadota bacterium]
MASTVSGTTMTWHKITVDFTSPQNFSENATTFRDYRLDVTFTNQDTGETIVVPGFFAADGNAANTNATSGNVWRVNFNPPSEGNWTYEASFRTGDNIAASTDPNAGQAVSFINGESGSIDVSPTDKTGEDFRAKGMIVQGEDSHHLQHQGDGDYFVRGGPGVPENFLANSDIDGTSGGRHDFNNHASDFNAGDPTWDGGKGTNILGAVNYIADQDLNTIYILTNTAGGDGRDVWPWADNDFGKINKNVNSINQAVNNINGLNLDDFATYDVSKLAQWEILFDHMDAQGIYKNILFQETENDQLLNGGTNVSGTSLSAERLIYMREMIARFGHNNGIQWNLGEENTNSTQELRDMADFVKDVDAYDHVIVAHTFPGQHNQVYDPLIGFDDFDGLSLQTSAGNVREKFIEFRDKSAAAGDPWILAWDEDSSSNGIIDLYSNNPDSNNERTLRQELWGTLTVGGSGVNWYFKGSSGHSLDQNIDDFKAHESVWTWTSAATSFFNDYIPFWDMTDADGLTINTGDYVMAKEGEYYTIYLPYGEANDVRLDLRGEGGETFDVYWFNPREGGQLIADGQISGGGIQQIGGAPQDQGKDWVILVQNTNIDGKPDATVEPPAPGNDDNDQPQDDTSGVSNVIVENVHLMEDGRVVMQAEDGEFLFQGSSANNNWRLTKEFPGYKGDGVLLWTGNDYFGSNNAGQERTAPMKFQFTADEPGTYYITLRAIRPVTGEESDRNNDFFVKFEDENYKKVFFSGNREEFKWASTYDVNHQKSQAKVTITQQMIDQNDGVFELFVSGRSHQAGLDEIHIQKGSASRDNNAPSSQIVDLTIDGTTQPTPPQDNPGTPDPAPTPTPTPTPTPPTGDLGVDLYLIDAATNTAVRKLSDGETIDPDAIASGSFSIAAFPTGSDEGRVNSAKLSLNGSGTQTENVEPFALFGDTNGNYEGENFDEGTYTISVQLYSGANGSGSQLLSETISFEVEEEASAPAEPVVPPVEEPVEEPVDEPVDQTPEEPADDQPADDGQMDAGDDAPTDEPPVSDPVDPPANPPSSGVGATFWLIDADTDEQVQNLSENPNVDPDILSAGNYSIQAVPADGGAVQSAKLSVNGGKVQTENVVPYALYGDKNGNYAGQSLSDGSYTVAVDFYSGTGGTGQKVGSSELSFTVSDEVAQAAPPPAQAPAPVQEEANDTPAVSAPAPAPTPAPEPAPAAEPTPAPSIADMFEFGLADTVSDTVLVDGESSGSSVAASAVNNGNRTTFFLEKADGVDFDGSVRLSYDGTSRVENVEPYALFGDDTDGDFFGGTDFGAGNHSVEITVYEGKNGNGSVLGSFAVDFTIEEQIVMTSGGITKELIDTSAATEAPITSDLQDGRTIMAPLSSEEAPAPGIAAIDETVFDLAQEALVPEDVLVTA